MNNELYKTFINLADSGSLSKTSESMFISKQGVLKRINEIEKYIGVPLFIRSNKGFSLTLQGEYFYKEAKYILSYTNNVLKNVRKMKMEMPVTIRLGTSLLNQATVFNDLWNKYKLQYPNIKIDLVSFDDDAVKGEGLADHLGKDFDAFVGVFDSNLWYKNILFLKMKECQFCVAVPSNHELARKSLIKPQDLAGYQFIMPQYNSSPSVTALEDYLKRESPNIEIIHTVSNYDINVFNKAATHSVAMMSIDCWKDLHPNLITIPLESKIKIPYGIVYSKDKTKEVEIFIKIIETVI